MQPIVLECSGRFRLRVSRRVQDQCFISSNWSLKLPSSSSHSFAKFASNFGNSENRHELRELSRIDSLFANWCEFVRFVSPIPDLAAVLRLNMLDPAMGSGHFLVRATEWLAEQIVYHPTTRLMTEQIVHSGPSRRTREGIVKAGRIPVPPGISQEQAEIAYWRRRVVEACIYGVDVNPLAVELAKLSLWLTCIAADEPLNFLDHHLRHGNSLLSASPDELGHSPTATAQQCQEPPVFTRDELPNALAALIRENVDIEQTTSTEMELVKQKEQRWKQVRGKFQPFLDCADLWLAAYDGLPLDELNYRLLVRAAITPAELGKERMRVLLQSHTLTHLGQCDPFDATVDAAIFVARRFGVPPSDGPVCDDTTTQDSKSTLAAKTRTPDQLLFLQARPHKTADGKSTRPDKALETLSPAEKSLSPPQRNSPPHSMKQDTPRTARTKRFASIACLPRSTVPPTDALSSNRAPERSDCSRSSTSR